MAIQELDIHILHRAGHTNGNADALSRCPVGNDESPDHSPYGIISTLIPDEGDALELAELQRADNSLTAIIEYLETGILPDDEKYHVESDGTLRVILRYKDCLNKPMEGDSEDIWVMPRYLASYDATTGGLECGMTLGVGRGGCTTCGMGRQTRTPLTPIPVNGI